METVEKKPLKRLRDELAEHLLICLAEFHRDCLGWRSALDEYSLATASGASVVPGIPGRPAA